MAKPRKDSVPKKIQAKYDETVALSDAFCQEHLTDEYTQLCRKLAAKLSRKRPSPLARGRAKSWAAAILYTIARVNFLCKRSGDRSETRFLAFHKPVVGASCAFRGPQWFHLPEKPGFFATR